VGHATSKCCDDLINAVCPAECCAERSQRSSGGGGWCSDFDEDGSERPGSVPPQTSMTGAIAKLQRSAAMLERQVQQVEHAHSIQVRPSDGCSNNVAVVRDGRTRVTLVCSDMVACVRIVRLLSSAGCILPAHRRRFSCPDWFCIWP